VDAVVLLAAGWAGCSVLVCFLVAAVVARAERPPLAPSSKQSQPSQPSQPSRPAPRLAVLDAVPDEHAAPPSRSSLPDAA